MMHVTSAHNRRKSRGKLLAGSEIAALERTSRGLGATRLLARLAIVLSASGCNALLGIEEASLTCAGAPCDAGASSPRGEDRVPGPGALGSSAISNGGMGPLGGVGAAVDAGGLDASAPVGAANGSELPANVILPNPGGAQTGSADNSGSGGPDGDEPNDDEPNRGGDDTGNGSGTPGPATPAAGSGGSTSEPPPPPSPCAGRAAGEAFCSDAARISCGPEGSVASSLVCSSTQHCQQGNGQTCAACLTGDARCEGQVLTVCNAARSGFDSQICGSAALCNAARQRCEPAQQCAPSESRCRGRNLERCNAAGTALEQLDCGSPQRCNEAAGRCDVCGPGTARCLDSDTVAACDASGATETPIPCGLLESCSAGACVVLGLPLL